MSRKSHAKNRAGEYLGTFYMEVPTIYMYTVYNYTHIRV